MRIGDDAACPPAGTGTSEGMDGDPRVRARAAHPLPEEETAGSADTVSQAEAIIADSDERQAGRDAVPGTVLERRTSDEATPPPD